MTWQSSDRVPNNRKPQTVTQRPVTPGITDLKIFIEYSPVVFLVYPDAVISDRNSNLRTESNGTHNNPRTVTTPCELQCIADQIRQDITQTRSICLQHNDTMTRHLYK